MNFYSDKNVYEAGKERIRKIFDRYYGKMPVSVSFSGGKDSTVVLYMVKEIMDERGIKQIPVFWCDQEIEAPMVVDYCKYIFSLPWVKPIWVQARYPKYNAHSGRWEEAWRKEGNWLREKEKSGTYTDFDISDFDKYDSEYSFFLCKTLGTPYTTIGGLHIDESPMRRLCLLRDISFCPGAEVTGGNLYYPLFDWSVKDIWYYIFSNHLKYCKLYNYEFSRQPLLKCRVGSFWHEQSQEPLKLMKEIDPYWYDKVTKRMGDATSTVQGFSALSQFIRKLPPYFKDWPEYISYIIEHITRKEFQDHMWKSYMSYRKKYEKMCNGDKKLFEQCDERLGINAANCVIKEDHDMRGLVNGNLTIIKLIKSTQDELERNNKKRV